MSVLSQKDGLKPYEAKKSTFDLSHFNATTGKIGELIPVLCEEAVPGDFFKIKQNHLIRMLPLSGPIAQRVDLFMHTFFVANRTLFAEGEWNNFITGKSLDTLLEIDLYGGQITTDTIGNYFGIPNYDYSLIHKTVNNMPLRAYIKIYNDYYRNKLLTPRIEYADKDYSDKLLRRNWRKDYFTSALHTPQYGNASRVTLDLDYVNVAVAESVLNGTHNLNFYASNSATGVLRTDAAVKVTLENINTTTSGIDVNDIRYAYAYQDFLTRILKAGDEYQDTLLLLFGVKTQDDRLQMAEYIGGYSAPVIVNEITQTTDVLDSTDEIVTPLGTQGGTGYSFGNSDTINYYVPEHGYIITILSMVPKSIHYGGFDKKMLKTVPLDFYFPQFANLPEQAIQNQEIFFSDDAGVDLNEFGYIERYAEYKTRLDKITGEMTTTFNHLHLANIYQSLPELDLQFLYCLPREDAFAVQNTIHFFGQIGFDIEAERPMPYQIDNLIAFS